MITIENLQNSIYRSDLFAQVSDNPVIEEKQVEPGKLRRVTLITGANQVISCSVNYLKQTKDVNRKWRNALFCGMCDAVYLVEKDGKSYLLAVEMKSQEAAKAASQIITSIIKYKQMLTTYSSFLPESYHEVGIVIKQKPENRANPIDKTSSKSYNAVMVMKMNQCTSHCDAWLIELSRALQSEGHATVSMQGNPWDGIDLNSYLKQTFPIYQKNVQANCEESCVDITEYL